MRGDEVEAAPVESASLDAARAVYSRGRRNEDAKEAISRADSAPGVLTAQVRMQEADGLPDGAGIDRVSVTAGPEVYTPVRFNSFAVGPIRVDTAVLPGETVEDAHRRAYLHAHVLMEVEWNVALETHLRRVREATEKTRAASGRGRGE
jgi:predicted ATPase